MAITQVSFHCVGYVCMYVYLVSSTGFPAGSVIGQDCYLVASDSSAQDVNQDDRFKCIDDLEILELVLLSGILEDYDGVSYVPSDLPLDHQFLPGSSTLTQINPDKIARWTSDNKMLLNPNKSSYMVYHSSFNKKNPSNY